MNETILFVLVIVVAIAIVVSIALKNDKELNEQNLIINSENLTEEQKAIYLSINNTKNNIRTIKNIAIIILLIIIIPIIIRAIALLTGIITLDNLMEIFFTNFS